MKLAWASLWAILVSSVALSEGRIIVPNDNMTLDGIPPISMEIADAVDRYGTYRAARFSQWHPERLEMLISTRLGNTSQVHRVAGPGRAREQLTFSREPVLGVSTFVQSAPDKDFFTFLTDVGGDEFYQIYRYDVNEGTRTLLTDGEKRHSAGAWSEELGLLAYQQVDADADGAFTHIHVVDPLRPESDRLLGTMRGGGWRVSDWSPDGSTLVLSEYISINKSRNWVMDVETGNTKHLLPPGEETRDIAYRGAVFSEDGNGLYVTTDAGSEFRELTYIDLNSLDHQEITDDIDWDVSGFDLTEDGERIAFATNEAGRSKLYVMNTATKRIRPVAGVPTGVVGGLGWHNDNRHLAFSLTSASIPGDVFVLDADSGEIERWTHSETDTDTSKFPEAELVEWKSFDGETITGFLHKPPARFTGKRPVVISIHGGPEGQSRPTFLGRWNYFLNELGVAVLRPNVRGSAGFGKTFLKMDNGQLREGTYKDIGALLDWVGEQPGLDEDRIMIYGGSYGGHMTLATATRYSDRIRCSVNLFGLSNLRTFLENTQGYRRDLRRVEYGDERIPELREWMDASAPMAMVDQIRKPMLVQQGVNDPRVPKSESDQIVASLKKTGTPTWYLVFDDEGHGFRKKPNADFAFYTVIAFAQEYLLE